MQVEVDVDILTQYCCLEPKIGEQLLYLYPEFLSDAQRAAFELHLKGCDSCRERRAFWQATGLDFRVDALLTQVKNLFLEHHYDEAIGMFNHALTLQAELWSRPEGLECFQSGAWLSLTAARSKERDIMPYLAPRCAPDAYEMAAATPQSVFPLAIEYAEGKIKGKISTLGRRVFFELQEAADEFQDGILLVGKILQPVPMLKSWQLVPGQKQSLGKLDELFESIELPQVIDSLKLFQVFSV